jgi:hypothetical protein
MFRMVNDAYASGLMHGRFPDVPPAVDCGVNYAQAFAWQARWRPWRFARCMALGPLQRSPKPGVDTQPFRDFCAEKFKVSVLASRLPLSV